MKMLVSNSKSVIVSEVSEICNLVQCAVGIAQPDESKHVRSGSRDDFCLFQGQSFHKVQHLDLHLHWDALQVGIDVLNGAHQ